MSRKSDKSKNTGQGEADKSLEKKATNTDDQSQIEMNFGQEEKANNITEQEFKQQAEANMKKRAQEGQTLREEMEAQRKEEQELKISEEAQAKEKAEEGQRLREEAKAKKGAEKEQKLGEDAQVKKIAEEEQRLREEAEAKRKIKEENSLKEAKATTKFRDEQWMKFKEEADAKGNPESLNQLEYATETNESYEETPQVKNTSPKRKVLVLLLIAALCIAGIWIFSVFNEGSEKQSPILPNNGATEIENTGVTPAPETAVENQEASLSNVDVGETFGEGIIFRIDVSGTAGTIAYSKDVGPMTWKNAMNIHEQLGEGWRLPTMDELSEMYKSIGPGATNSGQFADELYWSDKSYDENQARLVRFSDGNTSFHYNKNAEHRKFKVRAVRDFEQ